MSSAGGYYFPPELDEEPEVQDTSILQLLDRYLPIIGEEPLGTLDNSSSVVPVRDIPISQSALEVSFNVPVDNSPNFAEPNEKPGVQDLKMNVYVPVISEEPNTSNEIVLNEGHYQPYYSL